MMQPIPGYLKVVGTLEMVTFPLLYISFLFLHVCAYMHMCVYECMCRHTCVGTHEFLGTRACIHVKASRRC